MKFSTICKKIKSGQFSIDNCKHQTNDLNKQILEYYNHLIKYSNGAGDGKWDKDKKYPNKDWDSEMRKFYHNDLEREYDIPIVGQRLQWVTNLETYCFACGENIHFTFNGKGLSANVIFDHEAINKNIKNEFLRKGQFVIAQDCPYANLSPLSVQINITDKLIFANWFPDFQEDCLEKDKYTTKYSLNAIRGRINIARWKAENQNIAYTQVGSCGGTYIWLNKERKHGYITTSIDEEVEFLKNYEIVGHTDVSVWRVEMADSAKIDIDQIKKKWKIGGDYADAALIKVPKGIWELTSHYDIPNSLSNSILAEISLINENN